MNSHARSPLVTSSKVVTQPSDVSGESRVDATDGDKDTGVDYTRDVAAGGRNAHYEANTNEAHADEDEGEAFAGTIGEPGNCYGKDSRRNIDRPVIDVERSANCKNVNTLEKGLHSEQLSSRGGVAKFMDDGWQE